MSRYDNRNIAAIDARRDSYLKLQLPHPWFDLLDLRSAAQTKMCLAAEAVRHGPLANMTDK
jgi:hypothetical protein